jgi:two-component system response regulator ResD
MSGSRILVVEDDIRLATTLERVLTTEGHQVELAGDGLEALRRAREQPFDLFVLDIMLPSLDALPFDRLGLAAAQAARGVRIEGG